MYIFPPLSAATSSILHPVTSRWCRDYEFSRQLIGDTIESLLFKRNFLICFFSPVHLHFILQPSAKSNTLLFIAFLCFRLCAAARKCFAKQQMDSVCACTCACVCVLQYVCVLREIRTMCVCYLPPGCIENNCPKCFLCLVMACCYLPPWCAQKK